MLLCAWGARVTAVADHGPKLVALSGLRIVPALAAPVGYLVISVAVGLWTS